MAFVRTPCLPSLANRNVGGSEPLPWLAISYQRSASHRLHLLGVAFPRPNFCTHTRGSRMRLQENSPLQHLQGVAIGRPAVGVRSGPGIGTQGRGQPYMPFRLQRDFQPCEKCTSRLPPLFATIDRSLFVYRSFPCR
jgi:hypothetical protein